MCAHREVEPDYSSPPITRSLIWLGSGESRQPTRDDEQSAHVVAGVVVLVVAALAWLVSAVCVDVATAWPWAAILPVTCLVGVLAGAISRAVAAGPLRSRGSVVGRGFVAVALGVVLGELAAIVLLSGTIDRSLAEQAAQRAGSTASVVRADEDLQQTRAERSRLDDAVEQALRQREEALVVARCEYNPRPDCPQVLITGDPGSGPEARTADEFLADAQRELDNALAARNARARDLDARIAGEEQALSDARRGAEAQTDSGLGARWIAMNEKTLTSPGVLILRLFSIGVAVLLTVLPLILRLWRGETTQDRGVAAEVAQERAELLADTSIGVKRAEVRAAVENLWAEQQLASARLAVEAQLEIDRELQRRRVLEARQPTVQTRSERVIDDLYLPIAAEAEAASLTAAEPPAEQREEPENLPAPVQMDAAVQPARDSGHPLMSVIPEVTKTATRWIRPFVPPIVASAIDTTTKPLRGMRQAFEETEEIQFWLKRTRKVSVAYEEDERPAEGATDRGPATVRQNWAHSARPADDRSRTTITTGGRGHELSPGE